MNWDQYTEAQKPLQKQFMSVMRKLELDKAMGKLGPADMEAMKGEARDILERLLKNVDSLQSIEDSRETMFMMLADVIGIKGDERAAMIRGEPPTLKREPLFRKDIL